MSYTEEHGHGLGLSLDPVSSVIGGISSLFGGNPKDANRIATNTRAYQQAISGSDGPFEGFASGLEFLRVHAVMGDADGGWATADATKDAATKYKQAQSVIASRGSAPAQPSPGTYAIPNIFTTGGPVVAGLSTGPLMIAGAAALGIYLLSSRRRR